MVAIAHNMSAFACGAARASTTRRSTLRTPQMRLRACLLFILSVQSSAEDSTQQHCPEPLPFQPAPSGYSLQHPWRQHAAAVSPAPSGTDRMDRNDRNDRSMFGSLMSFVQGSSGPARLHNPGRMYLSLLKTVLTGGITANLPEPWRNAETGRRHNGGCDVVKDTTCTLSWDGWARLTALEPVVEQILHDRVEGDFAEVGVLKGGITMFLQGMLLVHAQETVRNIWVVDSFEGMGSKEQLEREANALNHDVRARPRGAAQRSEVELWAGGLKLTDNDGASVRDRFLRHDLLRPNVKILQGRVSDVLTKSCQPIRKLALLRIDVDVYAATYHTLVQLYPTLSRGGFVLFDDVKLAYACKAMADFRKQFNVTAPIRALSGTVDRQVYWRKGEGLGAEQYLHQGLRRLGDSTTRFVSDDGICQRISLELEEKKRHKKSSLDRISKAQAAQAAQSAAKGLAEAPKPPNVPHLQQQTFEQRQQQPPQRQAHPGDPMAEALARKAARAKDKEKLGALRIRRPEGGGPATGPGPVVI